MTPHSRHELWSDLQSPGLLSSGGTEGSALCYGCKVMSRKATGVLPVTEDTPMDSQLSQWGGTKVGCGPGQYLVSGRPLSPYPTKESLQQVENRAWGRARPRSWRVWPGVEEED